MLYSASHEAINDRQERIKELLSSQQSLEDSTCTYIQCTCIYVRHVRNAIRSGSTKGQYMYIHTIIM